MIIPFGQRHPPLNDIFHQLFDDFFGYRRGLD